MYWHKIKVKLFFFLMYVLVARENIQHLKKMFLVVFDATGCNHNRMDRNINSANWRFDPDFYLSGLLHLRGRFM